MRIINICIITILFTGVYLATTVAVTNLFFYNKSNGSLIKLNDKIAGSKLIGQQFFSACYFQGRPSLNNYKNNISGNSNYPYYSSILIKITLMNLADFTSNNPACKPDLNILTESASGLDPHISYEAALCQTNRISKKCGIQIEELTNIINKKSKPCICGVFGKKIVNILELNIELKNKYAKKISTL